MATRIGAVVRPATRHDLAGVCAIEQASFSDPWTADAFAGALGNPSVLFLVAVPEGSAGGEVLGYLVAWFAGGEGEIANIAVAPAARRQGVGARLLEAALAAAARRATEQVFLEVRESNEAAQALYAAYGFEPVGRRRGYYRHPVEDALVLRARLSANGEDRQSK